MEEIKLPKLHPLLKIHEAAPNHDGQPQWVIHHPTSNQFYKIGWAEFEILSRFHKYDGASELIKAVNDETTLDIDEEDLKSILQFLMQNGLVNGASMSPPEDKSIWSRAAHGYLYFTVPLFKPERFLKATWPYVAPLFSRGFHALMMVVLLIAVMMVLPRVDEFLASFMNIFSMEGAILSFIILTGIKIIHEFAHAFTATKQGVPVPHMGAAFIVLYPILYTEATGAWRLKDKGARIDIGMAGVKFELYLAAIALIAWHFQDPGLGQMICFTIVMISLLGSLFINLNPLMRFDGYYVLSDYVGIENLHAVAIDCARHSIRKICLGLRDDPPHDFDNRRAFYLTLFGYAVIIYRFFLFLGIAVLVYMVFMKPLGLIAMILELAWFIGLPIWRELKIWWERRHDYMTNTRFFIFGGLLFGMVALLFIPTSYNATFPAVMHARDYQAVYAPAPSMIEAISFSNEDIVNKGDPLISLSSHQLDLDIAKAKTELKSLENLKRRDQTDIELFRGRRASIDEELDGARQRLNNLLESQNDLNITANFDGQIVDMNPDIMVGQSIKQTDLILRLIKTNDNQITAYIDEHHLDRFQVGDRAIFRPNYALFESYDAVIESIAQIDKGTIDFPILSSVYGGEIPSQNIDGDIEPLKTIYKVTLSTEIDSKNKITAGHVNLYGEADQPIRVMLLNAIQTIRRELSLN
jgi:putative peptide zinc metalloprotease protein